MAIERPHLAWPLRRAADGSLAAVEQDTIDDVRRCVRVLLRTPLGARPLSPATGVPDPTFSAGLDAAELEQTLTSEDNEPRSDVRVTTAPVNASGRQKPQIRVGLAGGPQEPR